ncbi:MAG: alpha/beta fold hydrolase [Spirochaetota bacterium]|nr:alpha/beta fold hydrolase [Spirochaetota bacterium]
MPIIENSTYTPPWWLHGKHMQSMYPRMFRRVPQPEYEIQRIPTPDGDFLDLDITQSLPHNGRLVILSHGMEGNSKREYIWGMARAFRLEGWNILAWNFRSCGTGINRQPRLYHCADLDDIGTVIAYARKLQYTRILLLGFSMGGNITLNYLGTFAGDLPEEILGGIAFSVPCDLADCSRRLDTGFNKVYRRVFLSSLQNKIRQKNKILPEIYSVDGLAQVKTLRDFDRKYTAPIHGFLSAEDYYNKGSCAHVLEKITRPTLLVNALNDPFLSPKCFPTEAARNSRYLYLETPREGGHVGFALPGALYWSERRALEFAGEHYMQPHRSAVWAIQDLNL